MLDKSDINQAWYLYILIFMLVFMSIQSLIVLPCVYSFLCIKVGWCKADSGRTL